MTIMFKKCTIDINAVEHHLEIKFKSDEYESDIHRFDCMDDICEFVSGLLHDLGDYVGLPEYKDLIIREREKIFYIAIADEVPELINIIINQGISLFNKANI